MSYPGSNPRGMYPPPGNYGAPPSTGYGPPTGQAGGNAPPSTFRPLSGGPAFMNPSTGGPASVTPPGSMPAGYGAAPSNMGPPSSSMGPPTGSAYGGYPAGMAGGPPTGAAPPSYGMPPSGSMGPPTTQYGAPSTTGSFAPPPAGGGGFAAPPSSKPNVAFFSPSGGAPVPAVPSSGGPPSFTPPGSGPPSMAPPTGGMGGPPMGMPPPPTGYGAPPSIPGGPPMGNVGPPTGPAFMTPTTPQYAAGYGQNPMPAPNSMVGMPTGFDSGTNLAAQGMPGSDPNMPGGIQSGQPPLPSLEEIDMSIQCNPIFLRSSVGKLINSQALANQSRLPLGIICKPMAGDKGVNNDEVEVVDFGSTGIVRCKRCRTYINPYVTWTDNGRRWRCNICGMLNDVPSTYFSHLDNKGQRRDRDQRPELCKASVEFVAPGDYMVRPPQPPVYYFLIDVSEPAVSSGMLQSACMAIKNSLDELPGSPRTQVGFITFDTHIHFYNLKSSLSSPQMLVVSDITDVIMPLPEDLLVNLQESRSVIESLLDSLPNMFKNATTTNSCTGPTLMAAKRVIQHIGGKLLLFQSVLPNVGEGALKQRENTRLLGTDKEHTMLVPEDAWYKTNAIDFSRLQVCVDTFLFSSQFTDLATISSLSKYTGGTTYYYPAFFGGRDGIKFEKELHHCLTRSTAFESVFRVRATRGLRFATYYGNYFVRGTDLLALPNCTSDSTFGLDLAYDDAVLTANVVTIQAALLYTNSNGERRIRVHTTVLPVTQSMPEMFESFDIDCGMNLLAKQAVDMAQKSGLENARTRVHQTTVEIMRACKQSSMPSHMPGHYGMPGQQVVQPAPGSSTLPNSLLLLPLYSMSLQKSLILRGGTDVRVDERAYYQLLLHNMDIEESKTFIYPRMFSIHDMGADIGLPSDNNTVTETTNTVGGAVTATENVLTAGPYRVRLPNILNLSYERLHTQGIVLLENGIEMFMWIGRNVNPAIISTLFGVATLEGCDMTKLSIMPENSDFSSRVHAVVVALREERPHRYMQLHFIKEGDGYAEAYFARYLIEDRANFSGGGLSYNEYHSHATRAIG